MRRIMTVVLAVGVLAAGCNKGEDTEPLYSCYGISLSEGIGLTAAVVEVGEVQETGEMVALSETRSYPLYEAQALRVVYQRDSLSEPLEVDGTVEFIDTTGVVAGTDSPVYLFLAVPTERQGFDELGVRMAGVEEDTGLRLLGDWDWCWSEALGEFVDVVIWDFVDVPEGVPPSASDELRLLAAWAQEMEKVARPRENGPITKMYLGMRPATDWMLLSWSTGTSSADGDAVRNLDFDGALITCEAVYVQHGRLTVEGAIRLHDSLMTDLTNLPGGFTGPTRWPELGVSTETEVVFSIDGETRTYSYSELPHPVLADLDQFMMDSIWPICRCQTTESAEVIRPCENAAELG